MKLKNALRAVSAAVVMATASLSASAAYLILDDWEINVPGFTPTLTQDIGHLNFSGGSATVSQQTDLFGNAYLGAKFVESGNIFSISYTKENSVGGGDAGPISIFGVTGSVLNQLQLVFTGVTGVVSGLNGGGGFHYTFTGGTYSLMATGATNVYTTVASGSIVGLGGNTGSTAIIGGLAGDSNVLATVISQIGAFDFHDTTGASLQPAMSTGQVLLQLTTTNTLNAGSILPSGCTFDGGVTFGPCVNVQVTSDGALNLVRDIPEPGSLALLGLGLFGLGAMRRRQLSK